MLFQLAQENEIALNWSKWLNKKYSCKISEIFEKTGEIQLNNCKSCGSGFTNFANLAICCLLKTHEKYGTACTNLYGAENEVKNFRQDVATDGGALEFVKLLLLANAYKAGKMSLVQVKESILDYNIPYDKYAPLLM